MISGNRWGGIDVRRGGEPRITRNLICNGLADGIVIGTKGKGTIEANCIRGMYNTNWLYRIMDRQNILAKGDSQKLGGGGDTLIWPTTRRAAQIWTKIERGASIFGQHSEKNSMYLINIFKCPKY